LARLGVRRLAPPTGDFVIGLEVPPAPTTTGARSTEDVGGTYTAAGFLVSSGVHRFVRLDSGGVVETEDYADSLRFPWVASQVADGSRTGREMDAPVRFRRFGRIVARDPIRWAKQYDGHEWTLVREGARIGLLDAEGFTTWLDPLELAPRK